MILVYKYFYIFLITIFILFKVERCLSHLNVDLDSEPESNLFLEDIDKSLDSESVGSQTDIKYFALVHPSSSVSVRANYGPLTVKQTVFPSYWTDLSLNPKRNESFPVNVINTNSQLKAPILNGELSAHLVTKEVRRSNPVLRVLFYVGHTSDYTQRSRIDLIDKTLCAALVVQYHKERLFGTCSPIKNREGVCLTEVTIPASFWPPLDTNILSQKQQKATTAKVYYAITNSEQCSESSFVISTDTNSLDLNYLSEVSLVPFRGSYEEITNDNVVTILIPQEPVFPNSKIYIPVKFTYNPENPIPAFSLRAKVKSGVRILGAQLSHPNKLWQLSVELSPKQTTATVTAFLRDFDVQQDSQSITEELLETVSQEVYSWLIEVDEDVDINENGRIVWQLLYVTESSIAIKQDFDKESAKLSSRIDIQKDNVLDVLAITKSKQLLNTALLTGRQVSQAMRIYMVSAAGRISDITLQSSCHSADESILKVSPSCTSVYLDGSEVRGDQNATILVKYGGASYQKNFFVWKPELPIEIRVEDEKLSQIKGWKTQIKRKHSVYDTEEDLSIGDESFNSKQTNVRIDSFDSHNNCKLRYQQTGIELYTKFFSIDHNSGREASLLNRRISIRVTHLLMPYIRVSDPKVLELRANIIEGLSVGRSEVQVISPITGQLMGSKEIRVASDKETITHLDVKVVAGLELQVKPYPPLNNVWMTKTILLDKLTTQYQEGLLDIKLHFSDGNSVDLSDVSSSDYDLSVDTFDGAVALAPNTGPYPRVIAIGPGRGQLLHLSLELSSSCQRKRTQPLAMKYVNVNVDFSTSGLQNDAFNYRKTNGMVLNRNNQTPSAGIKFFVNPKTDSNEYVVIGKSSDGHPNMNVANLEVGIYSFFAIFTIAFIIVAVLYRMFGNAKTPPETITTTRIAPIGSNSRPIVADANEWVWLGRATLERNSVGSKRQTLVVPQKDFNGNIDENAKNETKDNRLSNNRIPSSEISIRITTNPNPVEDIEVMNGREEKDIKYYPQIAKRSTSTQNHCIPSTQPPIPARKTRHLPSRHTTNNSKAPPVPPHRNPKNLNEIKKMLAEGHPPPVPPHRHIGPTKRLSNSHNTPHNLTVDLSVNKSKNSERNKSRDKLDYNQLMEYFDSLKESNA